MSDSGDALVTAGLDVGSTTTSLLIARGRIARHGVTGRMELVDWRQDFFPEPVFTPFIGAQLDAARLAGQVDAWLAAAPVERREIAAGGAIVTGLAAQGCNAAAVAGLVRERFGEALIATADDPRLESWLAFMGSCAALSRAEPTRPFLHLDIGGGTTNLAWGRDGQIERVGCYHVGARHLQFEPGTYRLRELSALGRQLLEALAITRQPGDELSTGEVAAVVDFYATLLEAIVQGDTVTLAQPIAAACEQVRFERPSEESPIITFSGGVGALIYRQAAGQPLPATTAFGDLGIDLARRIAESQVLAQHLRTHVPEHAGRATVCGLALRHVELSGATLFLPRPDWLPLADLPIIGRLTARCGDERLRTLLDLAAHAGSGACLSIELADAGRAAVQGMGRRLAAALKGGYPSGRPLVLLVWQNVGKTLGQYATEWGALGVRLIVLDEIADRDARFASLGRLANQTVPVTFYALGQ